MQCQIPLHLPLHFSFPIHPLLGMNIKNHLISHIKIEWSSLISQTRVAAPVDTFIVWFVFINCVCFLLCFYVLQRVVDCLVRHVTEPTLPRDCVLLVCG